MKMDELINESIKVVNKGLFFIGARPAMGKTSFALKLACELAKNDKVAYITMETSKDSLVERIIASEYITNEAQFENLDVFEEQGATITEIANICSKDYSFVLIDYIQLIDREDGNIADIQKALKILSQRINCSIIVLSQLTREIDERDSHIPAIEDLSLTGIDETLYDDIFLLYRAAYYYTDEPRNTLKVITRTKAWDLTWIDGKNAVH